ncbi:hypothetical protein BDW69DRAFT_159806 [Aspergillus filifer]
MRDIVEGATTTVFIPTAPDCISICRDADAVMRDPLLSILFEGPRSRACSILL